MVSTNLPLPRAFVQGGPEKTVFIWRRDSLESRLHNVNRAWNNVK